VGARAERGIVLDYLGFTLLVVGMCALQIVLDKGQEDDWFASSLITDLSVTAVLALAAFVVWEVRRADPIVDLRLLGNRNFAIGNLLMFVLGFVLLATTVLLPLFVQILLGYTATEAGLVLSPGGFATMLMMPVVGMLSGRIDARWLIAVGLVAAALALYHMTGFDADVDYATIAWARVYQSLGLALLFIPINTAAYRGVPPEKSNNASALINMMRNVGGSIGVAVVTTFVARREQYHQNVLVAHVTPYSTQYNQLIHTLQQAVLAAHANAADALRQAQAQLYALVQKQATMLSYIDAFWLLSVVLIALVPLVLVLGRSGGRGTSPPAH
jgi:DHA2 family multidrug resistance protein